MVQEDYCRGLFKGFMEENPYHHDMIEKRSVPRLERKRNKLLGPALMVPVCYIYHAQNVYCPPIDAQSDVQLQEDDFVDEFREETEKVAAYDIDVEEEEEVEERVNHEIHSFLKRMLYITLCIYR